MSAFLNAEYDSKEFFSSLQILQDLMSLNFRPLSSFLVLADIDFLLVVALKFVVLAVTCEKKLLPFSRSNLHNYSMMRNKHLYFRL